LRARLAELEAKVKALGGTVEAKASVP